MAKSFTKNNPALPFFTPSASDTPDAPKALNKSKAPRKHNAPKAPCASIKSKAPRAHEAPKASSVRNMSNTPKTSRTSEIKSRRFSAKLYPSVMDDIELIARIKGTTPNDLINVLLSDFRDENMDLISKYNEVFG